MRRFILGILCGAVLCSAQPQHIDRPTPRHRGEVTEVAEVYRRGEPVGGQPITAVHDVVTACTICGQSISDLERI